MRKQLKICLCWRTFMLHGILYANHCLLPYRSTQTLSARHPTSHMVLDYNSHTKHIVFMGKNHTVMVTSIYTAMGTNVQARHARIPRKSQSRTHHNYSRVSDSMERSLGSQKSHLTKIKRRKKRKERRMRKTKLRVNQLISNTRF